MENTEIKYLYKKSIKAIKRDFEYKHKEYTLDINNRCISVMDDNGNKHAIMNQDERFTDNYDLTDEQLDDFVKCANAIFKIKNR